ncbi:alpha-galactosidase [Deinobacterium chartae]|uniref:Alpha-galactosidase n=1 Tax=Deinobacterium chartae TaxID=521158 RepID=A0A841HWD5_9DEIO|nr:alpha-galactosidase [Deinobacterium chartae]MBB6097841.1 alpha-galactosidase [Deinobacterium chartae]
MTHSALPLWVLETRTAAYSLGLDPDGRLVHTYWGPRLPRSEDYPRPPAVTEWASFNHPAHLALEEYPGYGAPKYIEPALKLSFADGTRDVVLRYDSAEQDGNDLRVHLRDAVYPLTVTLHYRVHPEHDLIERWTRFENGGSAPVTLERVFSAQWHPPQREDYRLSHLTGRWLDEFRLQRETLPQGVTVLESRRLTTSHHHNPWFALDDGTALEESGEVWFGALAWSGNWKLIAERTDFGNVRIGLGLNDWDFAWRLGGGESFETPPAVAGYTPGGFGAASRALHRYIRDRVLPRPQEPRKVLYNSWEATLFDVDERSQAELAELAAEMGIELFVVDDGWFNGRNSDRAGLGDWWPDPAKFPQGLNPLIERVQALGMQFGLWIEPEMVNPDSELYRAHPDWVIHFPRRERTEARNQLILNLGRRDVQDHLIATLDRLLAEHDIRFIKWDMNRNVSEPGWPEAPGDPRELWARYVHGLYRVWGTLAERHPQVVWQSCSGGGGRADLGILRLADQIWVSDNTHAAARLQIQEGFSQVFPASTMEAWVTDADRGRLPLEFRFHVSMMGNLGVGGHLARWTPEEREVARAQIALYKRIRPLVQFGDLYRLRSAHAGAFSAVQYVSQDRSEAVLFAFRTHLPRPGALPPLRLRGLDPQARYLLEGEDEPRSGAAWMNAGLRLTLEDFSSAVLCLSRTQ